MVFLVFLPTAYSIYPLPITYTIWIFYNTTERCCLASILLTFRPVLTNFFLRHSTERYNDNHFVVDDCTNLFFSKSNAGHTCNMLIDFGGKTTLKQLSSLFFLLSHTSFSSSCLVVCLRFHAFLLAISCVKPTD